jgi:hypothetical protein
MGEGFLAETAQARRWRLSEYDRPETIEEMAELIDQVGGHGIAVSVDHLDPEEVRSLVGRSRRSRGDWMCSSTTCWAAST